MSTCYYWLSINLCNACVTKKVTCYHACGIVDIGYAA